MKIRQGFVSNSSSSSFICDTSTGRHYGDCEGSIRPYYGYFMTRDELRKLLSVETDEDEDDLTYKNFDKAGITWEYAAYASGYFFGLSAEDTSAEAVKAKIETALSVQLEKMPSLFIVGSIET